MKKLREETVYTFTKSETDTQGSNQSHVDVSIATQDKDDLFRLMALAGVTPTSTVGSTTIASVPALATTCDMCGCDCDCGPDCNCGCGCTGGTEYTCVGCGSGYNPDVGHDCEANGEINFVDELEQDGYDVESVYDLNKNQVTDESLDKYDYGYNPVRPRVRDTYPYNMKTQADSPKNRQTKAGFADNPLENIKESFAPTNTLLEGIVNGDFTHALAKVVSRDTNNLTESEMTSLAAAFINLLAEDNSSKFDVLRKTYHKAVVQHDKMVEYKEYIRSTYKK